MDRNLEELIAAWPKGPKESALRLADYYGEPDEYSQSQLIWYNTHDGWKRTVLSSEQIPHDFPAHHMDYLEQFIDYRVPVGMFDRLAEYDGSVIVERTRGEMSARCAGTSMNFVAINLAHDIVSGKRSVEEARGEYARLYEAFQNGEKPPYTQAFQFELPRDDTKDADVRTLGARASGTRVRLGTRGATPKAAEVCAAARSPGPPSSALPAHSRARVTGPWHQARVLEEARAR